MITAKGVVQRKVLRGFLPPISLERLSANEIEISARSQNRVSKPPTLIIAPESKVEFNDRVCDGIAIAEGARKGIAEGGEWILNVFDSSCHNHEARDDDEAEGDDLGNAEHLVDAQDELGRDEDAEGSDRVASDSYSSHEPVRRVVVAAGVEEIGSRARCSWKKRRRERR